MKGDYFPLWSSVSITYHSKANGDKCVLPFWKNGETSSASLSLQMCPICCYYMGLQLQTPIEGGKNPGEAYPGVAVKGWGMRGYGRHLVQLHNNIQQLTTCEQSSFSLTLTGEALKA